MYYHQQKRGPGVSVPCPCPYTCLFFFPLPIFQQGQPVKEESRASQRGKIASEADDSLDEFLELTFGPRFYIMDRETVDIIGGRWHISVWWGVFWFVIEAKHHDEGIERGKKRKRKREERRETKEKRADQENRYIGLLNISIGVWNDILSCCSWWSFKRDWLFHNVPHTQWS